MAIREQDLELLKKPINISRRSSDDISHFEFLRVCQRKAFKAWAPLLPLSVRVGRRHVFAVLTLLASLKNSQLFVFIQQILKVSAISFSNFRIARVISPDSAEGNEQSCRGRWLVDP